MSYYFNKILLSIAVATAIYAAIALLGETFEVDYLVENIHRQLLRTVTTPRPTSLQEEASGTLGSNTYDFSCLWSTNHIDNDSCLNLIQSRLPNPHRRPTRRWLFMGDSTMERLFTPHRKLFPYRKSNIHKALISHPQEQLEREEGLKDQCLSPSFAQCDELESARCNLMETFEFEYPDHWTFANEVDVPSGPHDYGAENPHCMDSQGHANFLKCMLLDKDDRDCAGKSRRKRKFVYGGYITLDFARDMEIQTPQFLYSQENIAAYVDQNWNTPELVKEMGKPVCVVSSGIHDSVIDNISTDLYVDNVKFMLDQFLEVCDHIIWLGNTAPRDDWVQKKYPQTKKLMKSWDNAVKELIEGESQLRDNMSFIDLFEFSLEVPHDDNIHMVHEWYEQLGDMLFLPLIQGVQPEEVADIVIKK